VTKPKDALESFVKASCKELRLPTIAGRAASLAVEAGRANQGHLSYLCALLEAEQDDRAERRRHRRITEARFPRLKRLDDFNFEEAPQIPAATIRELASCTYIERAENVVFLGEPGTGKSHLGIALGIAACMQSRRVRFTTTAALVNELIEARDERLLSKLVARYAKVEQIKRFKILDHDFTVESGELTPSLKLKRNVVYDNYSDAFDDLYS